MAKKVLEQTACPNLDCGSTDAFTVFRQDDGQINAWCFSCATYFNDPYGVKANMSEPIEVTDVQDKKAPISLVRSPDKGTTPSADKENVLDEALAHPVRELKERGISFSTADRYGVRVGVDTRDGVSPTYYLFPVTKDGDLSGFLKKTVNPKSYQCLGSCNNSDLFGQSIIPQKGKKLFITEGPEDCLSVYQVLKENSTIDWEPAVIALCGAEAKVNKLLEQQDLLSAYDEIVLILDNDRAGKAATKTLCKALAGKVYTVKLPFKDPSEMLVAGQGEQLKWAVLTGARKYQPDGIVNAKDMWGRYVETKKVEFYPFPDSMPQLNKMLYGAKAGTVTTLGAGTSIGKTTFMRELKYHFLTTTEHKIADIELEADVTETLKSLVGLKLNKRITLPDVNVDSDKEKEAYEDLFSSGRYTLYDYFGGMDDDSLFSKLRYFASTGHKFIFLDHLSIIVSEYASNGGERERIDTIMTKLAKLAKETNTCIFLVVHLKKHENSKESFEQGAMPDLDDLRGSSTIKQLSWDVIFLSRNTQHPDPECAKITEITSAKCRLTGRTGNAGYVKFDESTGRYVEITPPPNYKIKLNKNDR